MVGGGSPLSIYVHIPFCESVCYYCACNKVITKQHGRAVEYLQALETEIDLHARALGGPQPVSQLHLGGGTPTFLSDEELSRLMTALGRAFRIAAGGLQAISRLKPLLNPIKFGVLSFQYISHRVLRWTLAPAFLPIIFLANVVLVVLQAPFFYKILLVAQVLFYLAAAAGWLLERREMKVKAFFVPYYFCIMNYAVYAGFGRFWRGQQSVLWERAERKK